jgi:hypothetical protein
MAAENRPERLKLAPHLEKTARTRGLLPSGVGIDCTLHEIEHPEGRFRRMDGTRYDICVMELLLDPAVRSPSISRVNFVGDGADTRSTVIRLGNVRMSSFRLHLVTWGEAFGILSGEAKTAGVSAVAESKTQGNQSRRRAGLSTKCLKALR